MKKQDIRTYEEYAAWMRAKNPDRNYSDQALTSYFAKRAVHGEDDIELPETAAVRDFEKSPDFGGAIRRLRMGRVGALDNLYITEQWDKYYQMRPRVVRPLSIKRTEDYKWDHDYNGAPRLIAPGEIPPPRHASVFQNTRTGQLNRTTRRSCAKGRVGLPCDHSVGSNECNGGVPVMRRIL